MKKIIFALFLTLLPFFVYAAECPTIIDTQTNDDRELTCDYKDKNITITTFSTTSEKTVLTNDVCSVKCNESVVFSIDPIKKVLAGTSFNYPLYVSGERKCVATYDYVKYETTIRNLVNEYASLTGEAKATKGNELSNYYEQKKKCDEFHVVGSDYQSVYKMNANVKLNVQTSKSTQTLNYQYKSLSNYFSESNTQETRYLSCNYDENTKTCNDTMLTTLSWKENARIYGKYTMPTVYVEKYTGEVKNASTATTCNASDRFFVNFNELTNPKIGDKDNNGYKLTLIADGLGNNLIPAENNWKLKVNCWYQVKNLSFPNGGKNVSTNDTDENYAPYGNSAFEYRLIDLENPFPGRDPNANWYGKADLISSTIDTDPKYTIFINSSYARRIREYNKSNPYVTFKMDENDKSLFVQNNIDIITREW